MTEKDKIRKALIALSQLKAKDVPPEKRELFKLIGGPMKACAKMFLRKEKRKK